MTRGNDAQISGHAIAAREKRFDAGRGCVVDAAAPAPIDVKDNLLPGRSAEEEQLGVAQKILVLRKNRKIPRTEKLSLLCISER